MGTLRTRSPWIRRGVSFVLFAVIASAEGCVSHELPAPLSASERTLIKQTRIEAIAGLQRPQQPDSWDSQLPLEALRATKIFKTVDYLDRLKSPPDVIVRGEALIKGSAVVPILTVFTLGLIPTRTEEGWGFAYSFRSPKTADGEVSIQVMFRGETVLGWTCVRLNRLTDRSKSKPVEHQRMYDRLALEVAANAAAIRKLAAK